MNVPVTKTQRNRVPLLIFALLLGCAGSLLIAETLLRVSNLWIGRHSDTMFSVIEYDETLGWKMKANQTTKVDLVDVEDLPMRSNRAGFRDGEFLLDKPKEKCRITFLGDSYTWGLGVREEERFSELLEKENLRWESFNFGIPGYGTDQSLLLWRIGASRYRPDLVILTVYQNDYFDNMTVTRYGRQKPYFELDDQEKLALRNVPVNRRNFWDDGIFNEVESTYADLFSQPIERRSRAIHWLAKNSDVVRLCYTLFRNRRMTPPAASQESLHERKLSPTQQIQVKLLGKIVRQLAQEVSAAGARFLVVVAGKSIPEHERQMKDFQAEDIPFLNATDEVLASFTPGREPLNYRYSGHWTPQAHRVVATLLAKAISEEKLCLGELR